MKLQAINYYKNTDIPKTLAGIRHNDIVPEQPAVQEPSVQKVYAAHLGFKGKTPLVKHLNDYKWFINNDKISDIEAFLKIDAPKEDMEELLMTILKDEQSGYNFIHSITEQPRQVKIFYKKLKEKLSPDSKILNFYSPDSPYKTAYDAYMDKRVQNAGCVSELLKIRPDWKEEVLLEKHRELYHNDDFELGFVPDSIGRENYDAVIKYLNNFTDYGFKTKKQINDLNINGRTFKFQNVIDGKSDKNVFIIETENGEKFIIKMGLPEQRGLNKPFAIGTCAIIDTYLTQNNCRNSAPLRYYNHNSNTAVFDFIEHNTADKILQFKDFKEKMPDFYDLGLNHNDTVGTNNYFIIKDNQKALKHTYDFKYGVDHGEFVSVDNDHVTYSQVFNPFVDKYNKNLPMAMQMFF